MSGRALWRRLGEAALRVPIFFKTMGIAVGLTGALSASMLWQIHETWHARLRQDADERARALGADIASHGSAFLLAREAGSMGELLQEARAGRPDVAYLLALDEQRRCVAGTLPAAPSPDLLAANDLGPDGQSRVALLDTEVGWVRDVAVPVMGGRGGTIRVGTSEEAINRQVSFMFRRVLELASVVGAFGIVAAWWLARALTRPVHALVELTGAVRRGDYAKRARVAARDELGELTEAVNAMTASLEEKERIRQALLRRVIEASEDERKRIARELHDEAGQSLTSLIAGLGAFRATQATALQQVRIAELEACASRVLQDVHGLARGLRPSVLDDLGLFSALSRLAEEVSRQFGISVELDKLVPDEGKRLPSETETTVYRIVQEALTNAAKHGRALRAHVLLQQKEDRLSVIVEDDGVGFDATDWRGRFVREGHLGILGIEERATLLGGTCRVESSPGSGTGLFIELPIPGKESREEDPRPDRG